MSPSLRTMISNLEKTLSALIALMLIFGLGAVYYHAARLLLKMAQGG